MWSLSPWLVVHFFLHPAIQHWNLSSGTSSTEGTSGSCVRDWNRNTTVFNVCLYVTVSVCVVCVFVAALTSFFFCWTFLAESFCFFLGVSDSTDLMIFSLLESLVNAFTFTSRDETWPIRAVNWAAVPEMGGKPINRTPKRSNRTRV